MELITHWISQIIIFILIATIIDLLIPTTSMTKYIKLVLGLILMLIFLQPIFYMFQIDIKQTIKTSFSQLEKQEFTVNSLENITEKKKNEIQASQDAYILEQMSIELIDLAENQLLEEHELEIMDIEFKFLEEQNKSYESLEEIIVVLNKVEDGSVNLVNEVIIGSNNDVDRYNQSYDTDEIQRLLQEVWEVTDKEITLSIGGGST